MKSINGAILLSAIGLKKAAGIVGSESALAKQIGVRKQKLNYWKLYTLLPCDIAMEISAATYGHVSLIELRPDLKGAIKKYEKSIIKKYKKTEGLQ